MGTRADYYVYDENNNLVWVGSTAYDGYPDGVPEDLLKVETYEDYLREIEEILTEYHHATRPEQGWPWPWEDSTTTDYAYVWDPESNQTLISSGKPWYTFKQWEKRTEKEWDAYWELPDMTCFPDMTEKQNVRLDAGSGLLVLVQE